MSSSLLFSKMIDASAGKMITVDFYKKDGTLRTLNGRIGVKKHLKGGGVSTVDHKKFISIYDVQNSGYRSIDRTAIKNLRIQGVNAVTR